MLKKIYLATGVTLLGLYATAGLFGWEPASKKRQIVPASVRNAPGGYRAFHFFHAGYRGGK